MLKIAYICNYTLMLFMIASITYCAVHFNNPKILFWYILVAICTMTVGPERKSDDKKK